MHAPLTNKSKTSSNIQVHLIPIHFFPKKKHITISRLIPPQKKTKFKFLSKHYLQLNWKFILAKKMRLPNTFSIQRKTIAPKKSPSKRRPLQFRNLFKWNRGQAAILGIVICTCRWSAHASIKGLEKSWFVGIGVIGGCYGNVWGRWRGRLPRAKYWRCMLNERWIGISGLISISS